MLKKNAVSTQIRFKIFILFYFGHFKHTMIAMNYCSAVIDPAETLSGLSIVGRVAGSQLHLRVTSGPQRPVVVHL